MLHVSKALTHGSEQLIPVLKNLFSNNNAHFIIIPGVEWILVHRHFACNSENPLIFAPLIIFQKNLKDKSFRVKKNVPKSFSSYFLTLSGSVRQEKLNIKNLPIKS
jgi:hypothetical protein